jgi:hypothetical protein
VVGDEQLWEKLDRTCSQKLDDGHPNSDRRLKFTVIDRDAERKCEVISIRYHQLPRRCELKPLSIEFDSPSFYRADFLLPGGNSIDVDIIYI